MHETNALVTRAALRYNRENDLTCWVSLNVGSLAQDTVGFGGFSFANKNEPLEDTAERPNFLAHFINRVLQIADAANLKHIEGRTVRIRYVEKEDGRVHVIAIGHPIEDKWFDAQAELKAMDAYLMMDEESEEEP